MDLSLLTEKIVSCMMMVFSLSLMIDPKKWIKFMDEIRKNKNMDYLYVFFTIPFGLFIIFTHNYWELIPGIFVTVIGWGAFIKGSWYLLHPKSFLKLIPKASQLTGYMRMIAPLYFFLSLWVYWGTL